MVIIICLTAGVRGRATDAGYWADRGSRESNTSIHMKVYSPENRRLMLRLLLISHLHSPLAIAHEDWESPFINKGTERDAACVNLSSAPITHFRAVDSARIWGEFWGRQSWSLDVAARLSLSHAHEANCILL